MVTWAERPELADRGVRSEDVWPEYNLHGDVLNEWWGPRGWELVHCEFGANAFGCVFKRRAY